MKITFLGTGGGRWTTLHQKRMTGGFRLDNVNGKNYHVDPGPGALVRTYQFGLTPQNLDGIFISHAHTDHYNDAEILIEAMTKAMTKENGIIIGSNSVFNGYKQWGPCISKYHRGKSQIFVVGPNKTKNFNNIKLKGTKTVHGDPTGIGFQMDINGFKLSYTADTQYFENLSQYHKDADILIASVIRPGNKKIRGHLCSNKFISLLNKIKPKLAIMTHFGLNMLNTNPVDQVKMITNETGVKTLAAFDGMCIDVNYKNPEKSKITSLKDKNSRLYKEDNDSSFQSSFSDNEINFMRDSDTFKRDFSASLRK